MWTAHAQHPPESTPVCSLFPPQQCSKKASASLLWLLKSSGIIANRPWPRIALTVLTTVIVLTMAVFNMVSLSAGTSTQANSQHAEGPPVPMLPVKPSAQSCLRGHERIFLQRKWGLFPEDSSPSWASAAGREWNASSGGLKTLRNEDVQEDVAHWSLSKA